MLELLNKVFLNTLRQAILEKNPDAKLETAEDIFDHLDSIYDEYSVKEFGDETGKVRFMPLRYKMIVMRIVFPRYHFKYKVIHGDTACSVDANLFLDLSDTVPISCGSVTIPYPHEGELSEMESKHNTELTAKGVAESKALQKFGIGSWFQFEAKEESPEVVVEQLKENSDFVPQKLSDDTEENSMMLPDPEKNIAGTPALNEESVASFFNGNDIPSEENDPISENPVSKNSDSADTEPALPEDGEKNEAYDLDSARSVIVDIGRKAGLAIGSVEKTHPQNLIWLYAQPECTIKDALRIVILNNERLLASAREQGLQL